MLQNMAASGGGYSAAGNFGIPTSDLNTINSYNSYTSNDSLSSVRGLAMSRALQQAQAGLLPESQASPSLPFHSCAFSPSEPL